MANKRSLSKRLGWLKSSTLGRQLFFNVIKQKRFSGNIFNRIHGLEYLDGKCKGASVLDVGCSNGMIAYEMARMGVTRLDGLDIAVPDLNFARQLFQYVPIETRFFHADLMKPFEQIVDKYELRDQYDIVLFLGIYHKFYNQLNKERANAYTDQYLKRAGRFFLVRTGRAFMDDIQALAQQNGFVQVAEFENPEVNKLFIFERKEG